jgi:vacuolar protein sorting-associated protein 13A/C
MAVCECSEALSISCLASGIFFVTKGTFGQLTCEWQYLFDEFTKKPMIVEGRRLRIEAKVSSSAHL